MLQQTLREIIQKRSRDEGNKNGFDIHVDAGNVACKRSKKKAIRKVVEFRQMLQVGLKSSQILLSSKSRSKLNDVMEKSKSSSTDDDKSKEDVDDFDYDDKDKNSVEGGDDHVRKKDSEKSPAKQEVKDDSEPCTVTAATVAADELKDDRTNHVMSEKTQNDGGSTKEKESEEKQDDKEKHEQGGDSKRERVENMEDGPAETNKQDGNTDSSRGSHGNGTALSQLEELERQCEDEIRRIESARRQFLTDQIQNSWGCYKFSLRHVLQLQNLSDAPDAILPGNF